MWLFNWCRKPAPKRPSIEEGNVMEKVLREEKAEAERRRNGIYPPHQTEEELYEICRTQLVDIESVLAAFIAWLDRNPNKVDRKL